MFRLGYKNMHEVKDHPWFAEYRDKGWYALERKVVKPPFPIVQTSPDKMKLKEANAEEMKVPPIVEDFELDSIFNNEF